LYVEEVIKSSDPRLEPLWKNKLSGIGSSYPDFIRGYKVGFSSSALDIDFKNHITSCSLVGDPYTFGIFFGNKMRLRLRRAFSNIQISKINKAAFALAKLFFSNEEYQNILNIFKLHSAILSGNSDNISEMISAQVNSDCKQVIPGTFIACGEGGNYCSQECMENATLGRHNFYGLVKSSGSLLNLAIENFNSSNSNVEENLTDLIESNEEGLAVETYWKSKVLQYRITSDDYNAVAIRMQFTHSELSYKFISSADSCQVIVWNKPENTELDITISTDMIEGWNEWRDRVRSADFSKPSTYRGSDKFYASLVFVNNLGFCLEDGSLVIPQNVFLEKLERSGLIKKSDIISNLVS
jgi:hypothetical protein